MRWLSLTFACTPPDSTIRLLDHGFVRLDGALADDLSWRGAFPFRQLLALHVGNAESDIALRFKGNLLAKSRVPIQIGENWWGPDEMALSLAAGLNLAPTWNAPATVAPATVAPLAAAAIISRGGVDEWTTDSDGMRARCTAVADVIGIEIEHVNFAAAYKDRVFAEFLRERWQIRPGDLTARVQPGVLLGAFQAEVTHQRFGDAHPFGFGLAFAQHHCRGHFLAQLGEVGGGTRTP